MAVFNGSQQLRPVRTSLHTGEGYWEFLQTPERPRAGRRS